MGAAGAIVGESADGSKTFGCCPRREEAKQALPKCLLLTICFLISSAASVAFIVIASRGVEQARLTRERSSCWLDITEATRAAAQAVQLEVQASWWEEGMNQCQLAALLPTASVPDLYGLRPDDLEPAAYDAVGALVSSCRALGPQAYATVEGRRAQYELSRNLSQQLPAVTDGAVTALEEVLRQCSPAVTTASSSTNAGTAAATAISLANAAVNAAGGAPGVRAFHTSAAGGESTDSMLEVIDVAFRRDVGRARAAAAAQGFLTGHVAMPLVVQASEVPVRLLSHVSVASNIDALNLENRLFTWLQMIVAGRLLFADVLLLGLTPALNETWTNNGFGAMGLPPYSFSMNGVATAALAALQRGLALSATRALRAVRGDGPTPPAEYDQLASSVDAIFADTSYLMNIGAVGNSQPLWQRLYMGQPWVNASFSNVVQRFAAQDNALRGLVVASAGDLRMLSENGVRAAGLLLAAALFTALLLLVAFATALGVVVVTLSAERARQESEIRTRFLRTLMHGAFTILRPPHLLPRVPRSCCLCDHMIRAPSFALRHLLTYLPLVVPCFPSAEIRVPLNSMQLGLALLQEEEEAAAAGLDLSVGLLSDARTPQGSTGSLAAAAMLKLKAVAAAVPAAGQQPQRHGSASALFKPVTAVAPAQAPLAPAVALPSAGLKPSASPSAASASETSSTAHSSTVPSPTARDATGVADDPQASSSSTSSGSTSGAGSVTAASDAGSGRDSGTAGQSSALLVDTAAAAVVGLSSFSRPENPQAHLRQPQAAPPSAAAGTALLLLPSASPSLASSLSPSPSASPSPSPSPSLSPHSAMSRSRLAAAERALHLQAIATACERLVHLSNDTLSLERLRAGKLALRREPAPLAATIGDAIALLRAQATAKGVAIRLQLANELTAPAPVPASATAAALGVSSPGAPAEALPALATASTANPLALASSAAAAAASGAAISPVSSSTSIASAPKDASGLAAASVSAMAPVPAPASASASAGVAMDSARVLMDVGRIVGAISNIVSNALRFSEAGDAITVHCALRPLAAVPAALADAAASGERGKLAVNDEDSSNGNGDGGAWCSGLLGRAGRAVGLRQRRGGATATAGDGPARWLFARSAASSSGDAAAGCSGGQPVQVVVSVTDQGPGIPAADLANLFVPFSQATAPPSSSTRAAKDAAAASSSSAGVSAISGAAGSSSSGKASHFGGVSGQFSSAGTSGLGLALAREFLRLHGGDLSVRSTVGHGCTFTLSFPTILLPASQPAQTRADAAASVLGADAAGSLSHAPAAAAAGTITASAAAGCAADLIASRAKSEGADAEVGHARAGAAATGAQRVAQLKASLPAPSASSGASGVVVAGSDTHGAAESTPPPTLSGAAAAALLPPPASTFAAAGIAGGTATAALATLDAAPTASPRDAAAAAAGARSAAAASAAVVPTPVPRLGSFTFMARRGLSSGSSSADGSFGSGSSPVSSAAQAQLAAALQGQRLLVVEDDGASRVLLARLLRLLGAPSGRVDTAEDGARALDAAAAASAARDPYTVIFADRHMPHVTGDAMARTLRSRGFAGSIIAVSGDALEAEHRLFMAAGANLCVSKPLTKASVADTLRQLLCPEPPAAPSSSSSGPASPPAQSPSSL